MWYLVNLTEVPRVNTNTGSAKITVLITISDSSKCYCMGTEHNC